MNDPITIEHIPNWRSELWDDDIPSRDGWTVTCRNHSWVGRDELMRPWAYASSGIARSVATRHRKAYHRP